jgi:hypothetical protein
MNTSKLPQVCANIYHRTVRLETGVTTYTLSSFLTSRHSKIILVLLCINLYCIKFYIQTLASCIPVGRCQPWSYQDEVFFDNSRQCYCSRHLILNHLIPLFVSFDDGALETYKPCRFNRDEAIQYSLMSSKTLRLTSA